MIVWIVRTAKSVANTVVMKRDRSIVNIVMVMAKQLAVSVMAMVGRPARNTVVMTGLLLASIATKEVIHVENAMAIGNRVSVRT